MFLRLAARSAFVACLGLPAAAFASDDNPFTFRISTDATSSFVFRGMELNDEVVFQPTLSMDVAGWNVSASGTFDLDADGMGKQSPDVQRMDYHVGYSHEFGRVTVGGGVYFYDFPNTGIDDTSEGYVKVAVRYPCSFGLTLYHDFDEARGEYVRGWIGHRFQLYPRTSLDLTGSLGWSDEDYNRAYYGRHENAVADFETRLSFHHAFTNVFGLHGYGAYSVLVEDRLRDVTTDGDNIVASVGADFTF